MFLLRDGSDVIDRRLGLILVPPEDRIPTPSVSALLADTRRPVSREWSSVKALNQGKEGCCVSMGLAHELMTPACSLDPDTTNLPWCVNNIYYPAQDIDPFPGSARPGASPCYEGTTLDAGLTVLKNKGLISGWRNAEDINDLLRSWSYYRPPVFALRWLSGMSRPDRTGRVRYIGKQEGGHCLCGASIEISRWWFSSTKLWLQQSWGPDHGKNGRVWISIADLELAINDNGQVVFLDGRRIL